MQLDLAFMIKNCNQN